MSEVVTSLSDRYEERFLGIDTLLINARKGILTYTNDQPNTPITDEERWDDSIHSYDTPSSRMTPEAREAAQKSLDLLKDRYSSLPELPGLTVVPYWDDKQTQAATMIHRVYKEWKDRYLDVRTERVGYDQYFDWVEHVVRYHPEGRYSLNTNERPFGSHDVLGGVAIALDDLTLDIRRRRLFDLSDIDKIEIPGVLVVPPATPGLQVETTEESGCFIAKWEDVGTDTFLQVPVSTHIMNGLRQLGLVESELAHAL